MEKLLTIGGSDSGGAAGIQADLKTFTVLGAYGMTVLTVVTAQNSVQVSGAEYMPASFVAQQLQAVLTDYGANGIKTGFIGQTQLIETVAQQLKSYQPAWLVVDPVLVNHKGVSMFPTAVMEAYQQWLFPLATLITPNRREAEELTGLKISGLLEAERAARQLVRAGCRAVLVKGVRVGAEMVDLLWDGQGSTLFRGEWLETENRHGSGDTLSAGILTFLARRFPLPQAIHHARSFTQKALRAAIGWQLGKGHGPLAHFQAGQLSFNPQ